MAEKVVGILGGMGPDATVDFMQRIINLTPANDDCDHIRLLVDNNPKVPSRIKAIIEKTGQNPAPTMIEMAKGLEKQGADFLVMPCNTAHFYYSDIKTSIHIPILNMIELTVEEIIKNQPYIKKVGLLASPAVLITGLYKKTFDEKNILLEYPTDPLQENVLRSIKEIKAGNCSKEQIKANQKAVDNLSKKDAEAIIIGCTELSGIAKNISFTVPFYDSSQILAENVVKIVKSNQL
jgi:aspartate racemase